MKLAVPKEKVPGERRIPLIPSDVNKLVKLGAQVIVERGLGLHCHYSDQAYQEVGAQLGADEGATIRDADIVLRLNKPSQESLHDLKQGTIHISYLDPLNERDLIKTLQEKGVSAFSMEMIPRTTLAQKMDALSSQASLAGYVAIIMAQQYLGRVFPMMMTPAGTIAPARIFIVGAGVAGLQAIATARRLGARVEAFDTRPVVKEQVESLGAKFVEIELGDIGQTRDGYAKALSQEQLLRQREAMKKVCSQSDVVITTAQVFGRRAPLIITAEMIAAMKPGSVIVDLAVESGGNVEGVKIGEVVELNRVQIIGFANLPGHVAQDASQMYSSNLTNFVTHGWDKQTQQFLLKLEDEILKGALITHRGEIVHPLIKEAYAK